jgi:hypothetical protein
MKRLALNTTSAKSVLHASSCSLQLSDAIKQYQLPPHRSVIWFHERQIQWDQVKIRHRDVSEETHELYVIVLRDSCTAHTATVEDVLQVRRMERIEWLALRTVEKHYRLCTLEKNTLRVSTTTSPPQSLTRSSNQLARSNTALIRSVELRKEDASLQFFCELWSQHKPRPHCIDICPILNAICDYTLMKRELRVQLPGLQEKWFRWLSQQFPDENDYTDALHLSLLGLCQYAETEQHMKYDALEVPLVREWMDFACFIFSQRLCGCDMTEFSSRLQTHIEWIENHQHEGLYHNWVNYYVIDCDNNPQLWLCDGGGGDQYTVSSLWLLQCDFTKKMYTVMGSGRIVIQRDVFNTLLLQMYRLMLSDLVHLVCSVNLVGHEDPDTWPSSYSEFYCGHAYIHVYTEATRKLQHSLHTEDCEALYAYQITTNYFYKSPVMMALVSQIEEQEKKDAQRPAHDPRRIASVVSDIEDLGSVVPPCIQAVMRRDWCKNWDRLNLVAWLYDSGYTKEAVVRYMCRNVKSQRDEERMTIAALYDDCVNPHKARKKFYGTRLSVPCATVINSIHEEEGNVLRCPFEEAKNGAHRRNKHTDGEKLSFRTQCAESGCLSGCSFSHPLDFIVEKINKR